MKFTLLFLLASLLLLSCNDSFLIGEDVLDKDGILFSSEDGLELSAKTVSIDSFLMFSAGSTTRSRHFLGTLDDPIFGTKKATLAMELIPITLANTPVPDAEIDSVVLTMKYEYDNIYGEKDPPLDLRVYELDEQIQSSKSYYSNYNFKSKIIPLAREMGKVLSSDYVFHEVLENEAGELDTIAIQENVMRIHLDKEFGKRLLSFDSLDYGDIDLFLKEFNGLKIDAESGNSLKAFSLLEEENGLTVYYNDSSRLNLTTSSIAPIVNTYLEDETKGTAYQHYDSYSVGDSVLFVGGAGGPEIQIDFENIDELSGRIINYAELILYPYDSLLVDQTLYPPTLSLGSVYKDENGDRFATDDYEAAVLNNSLSDIVLDGNLDTLDGTMRYRIKFTEFAQVLVDDDALNSMIITPRLRSTQVRRSVMYGANHSKLPIRVNIYYSEEID